MLPWWAAEPRACAQPSPPRARARRPLCSRRASARAPRFWQRATAAATSPTGSSPQPITTSPPSSSRCCACGARRPCSRGSRDRACSPPSSARGGSTRSRTAPTACSTSCAVHASAPGRACGPPRASSASRPLIGETGASQSSSRGESARERGAWWSPPARTVPACWGIAVTSWCRPSRCWGPSQRTPRPSGA